MSFIDLPVQDVMQVCRNGHVITDLLHTFPEHALGHCDRCGADTFDRCLTCGNELPGAIYVPDAVPIGERRPPLFCTICGASFPWTRRAVPPAPGAMALLERLLRRLPRVARQFRQRQGERPAFRVEDERDLEDLLRALLPIQFDDIRLESRTPAYSATTQTDFILNPSGIAITSKLMRKRAGESELMKQLREDIVHYSQRCACRTLVCFVYDPAASLPNPQQLELVCENLADDLVVRALIVS